MEVNKELVIDFLNHNSYSKQSNLFYFQTFNNNVIYLFRGLSKSIISPPRRRSITIQKINLLP